jgi:hypothetical protein
MISEVAFGMAILIAAHGSSLRTTSQRMTRLRETIFPDRGFPQYDAQYDTFVHELASRGWLPLLSLQPPGKECPHKPHRPRPSWRNHLACGEPLCWPHRHSSHSPRLQSGDSTRRVGGQRGHIGRVVLTSFAITPHHSAFCRCRALAFTDRLPTCRTRFWLRRGPHRSRDARAFNQGARSLHARSRCQLSSWR